MLTGQESDPDSDFDQDTSPCQFWQTLLWKDRRRYDQEYQTWIERLFSEKLAGSPVIRALSVSRFSPDGWKPGNLWSHDITGRESYSGQRIAQFRSNI